MNPNLFTDEFRNFKYLKSSPEHVASYKDVQEHLQRVPDHNWECQIQFVEQLLGLSNETVYLIEPDSYVTYAAMFYDRQWAQKYQRAVTTYLRTNNNAVSAISRLF